MHRRTQWNRKYDMHSPPLFTDQSTGYGDSFLSLESIFPMLCMRLHKILCEHTLLHPLPSTVTIRYDGQQLIPWYTNHSPNQTASAIIIEFSQYVQKLYMKQTTCCVYLRSKNCNERTPSDYTAHTKSHCISKWDLMLSSFQIQAEMGLAPEAQFVEYSIFNVEIAFDRCSNFCTPNQLYWPNSKERAVIALFLVAANRSW